LVSPSGQIGGDHADDAAAEGEDAENEDDPLDDCDPRAELGEVMLHAGQQKRADDWAQHRAEPADQGHQHDLARHRPLDIGQ